MPDNVSTADRNDVEASQLNDGNELNAVELSRRLMADMDEMLVEFELDAQSISRKLHEAKDAAQVEALGMSPRPFGDNDLLKVSDALYLPELGGYVLRNGQREASRTFTKASLTLAIEKGDLAAIWKHNKWHVTPLAVRAWAAQSEPKSSKKPARKVKAADNYGYKAPSELDRAEKADGGASVAAAMAQMDALDAMLKNRKKKGK